MDTNMQNLNTNEMTGRGVIVLNVSEMPQENISVGKGKNYLLVGDNSVWLKKIPNNSIDSIVTDPPAGISFMARGWDSDKGGRDNWIAWMCEVATECKRVLKPGGHAFVWAIPRTSHWTATAWENAGFEIRDVVAHIFGSGFPKSANIQKHLQKIGSERAGEFSGWGSALKPAREDWILMRKPLEKGLTIAENVLKYGTGGLNIAGSRVGTETITQRLATVEGGKAIGAKAVGIKQKATGETTTTIGRWPANLIHDGSEEVVGLFPNSSGGAFPKKHGSSGFVSPEERESRIEMKDSGSAARFFKECKPDILCYLCNCTIDDKHGKMSVINSNLCSKDAKTVERILSQDITTITSDSVVPFVLHDIQLKNEGKEAQSQSHARNVEKSSPVSQATTESIAQTNAEDLEEKQAVQNAKSAGNLCDLCATSIVQSIVAMKQGQDPALPLGLVSTSERKKQILTKCLASYVAALGNTDTILTTGSLSLFFGFVRDAIENTTSRERSEQKGSSEQSQQRLRYCSKASKKDRDEGLEGFEEKNNMRVNAPRESEEEKLSTMTKNFHPTVKPTALMRYLVKLVTPPGGTVLDPFTGSGSTGKACKLEGFEFIGIEREEEYVKIAEARIAAVTHQPTLV